MVKAVRISAKRAAGWVQDPERVRADILETARRVFVEKGLAGARVDEIAALTSTSKRMIYYYFGDKERLYRAVLEEAYRRIRDNERKLDVASLPPREAMAALAGFTFDHHADNPDFVRLVMVENIHRASHLRASDSIAALNSSVIGLVEAIYRRGVEAGVFRPNVTPLDIHLTISALAFYNVSNQATIQTIFAHDMSAPASRAARREHVVMMVLAMLAP
jgi:AcrR family transcriptional regulator